MEEKEREAWRGLEGAAELEQGHGQAAGQLNTRTDKHTKRQSICERERTRHASWKEERAMESASCL